VLKYDFNNTKKEWAFKLKAHSFFVQSRLKFELTLNIFNLAFESFIGIN